MANSAPSEASDFNTKIITEFRANQGRVGGPLAGTPMILIHHTGAQSRIERVTPLACSHQPDGRLAIVAASGGSPRHPDWYYNLKASPTIRVEVGTRTFPAVAERLDGTAFELQHPAKQLYAVHTDGSGLAGTCSDVYPATPLQAISPQLAAVAPSLPLGTATTQTANSPIAAAATSSSSQTDC